MLWWFKARRIAPVLLPSMTLFALLVLVMHDGSVELPALLTGGNNSVVLTLVTPLLVTSGLLFCLTSRLLEGEIAGQRPVARYDALLIAAVMILSVAIGAAAGWLSGSETAWGVGRNTAYLTGLMLGAHAVVPPAAVMLPIGCIFTVIFLGYDQYHRPYPWTILPEPATHVGAALVSVAVFTIGLAAFVATRRNATVRGT